MSWLIQDRISVCPQSQFMSTAPKSRTRQWRVKAKPTLLSGLRPHYIRYNIVCVGVYETKLAPVPQWDYMYVNVILFLFDISFLEIEDIFISFPLSVLHACAFPVYVLTMASSEELLSFRRQVVYLKFTEIQKRANEKIREAGK